jgi:hypothetical protein
MTSENPPDYVPGQRFPILLMRPMEELPFQITSIPWSLIEPHEAQARKNHSNLSLKTLAEKGGLTPCDAIAVLEDSDRPDPSSDIDQFSKQNIDAIPELRKLCELASPINETNRHPSPSNPMTFEQSFQDLLKKLDENYSALREIHEDPNYLNDGDPRFVNRQIDFQHTSTQISRLKLAWKDARDLTDIKQTFQLKTTPARGL